jgi:hypothetical protein
MRNTVLICVVLLASCAIEWAAGEEAAPGAGSLLGGSITYAPPPDDVWQKAENIKSDVAAAYAARKHQGAIAIEVLPADSQMTPQMGGAVVRALRDAHTKAGQKILMGPKVEPDKRFILKVHEKYEHGDKVADELHLYKNVGPRVVMLTVNTWVNDDTAAAPIHAAGEDVLVSAKFVKHAK